MELGTNVKSPYWKLSGNGSAGPPSFWASRWACFCRN